MTVVDSNIFRTDPRLIEGFKGAMGMLGGGVTVITTGVGENRRGLTATAVCSLSATPPMILACVNRSGEARQAIATYGYFCVNVLSSTDREVADVFAGRAAAVGSDKFGVAGDWGAVETGAPALRSALVSIDCELSEKVETHTHTVFLGLVRGLQFNTTTDVGAPRPPLVYWDRLYRDIH